MMKVDQSQLLRNNRWICIQMEQCTNRALEPLGITAIQAHLLFYILDHGEEGTSLTTIHRTFGYSMATLSGMLKRLREKGYLRVEHCADDDRRKLLFGTEKSQRDREGLERAVRLSERQLYGCFSEEELRTLDGMQQKLLRHLSTLTEERRKETTQS